MTRIPPSNKPSQLQRGWARVRSMHDTQRMYIYSELSHARDLLPILMKHRNGDRWSKEERKMLVRNLRAVSNLSPYLIPILLPGGVLILPLFAWWLDRRRKRRDSETDPQACAAETRQSGTADD